MTNKDFKHPISGIDENGHPYSCGGMDWNGPTGQDYDLLTCLPNEEQDIVLAWIKDNIMPRKTPNYMHTSYGIKHRLQWETGIYMTNNMFKDAMLICGFSPVDTHELNWRYCISEKSPVFKRRKHSYRRT